MQTNKCNCGFNKTLLTNTDSGMRMAHWPLFADPYQRLLREMSKPEVVMKKHKKGQPTQPRGDNIKLDKEMIPQLNFDGRYT